MTRSLALTERQVLTPATLAAEWGCSKSHVYALIHSGQLEHFKLGDRLIRITRQAVEDFQCRNTVSPCGAESGPSSTTETADDTAARLARQIEKAQNGPPPDFGPFFYSPLDIEPSIGSGKPTARKKQASR